MTMKRMNSTVSDSQWHFMHLFHGPDLRREAFDIDLEDEEWTSTQGPISHVAVISSKISEKIAARQHARLQGGGAADAPPVVPPPPAHVPAPTPVPAHFSQFQHAVMERLDVFYRRFTQIRADSLRSLNSMARIQADHATQQSRIHSLSEAQAQMRSVLLRCVLT
ncbi:hypothetical protein Dimus_030141 [Dionaea muscipula]